MTSTNMPEKIDSDNLSEERIIKWLQENPGFLQNNPHACDFLIPPNENKGKKIADFQSYMIKRLKDDKEDIIEEAKVLVETSRANMSNQAQIHQAVLLLLEAQNFEDFIRTITIDFASLLNLDIISLLVETEGQIIPHIDISGVRAVNGGTIDLIMKDQNIILESNVSGLDEIYGGGAGLVKSQMLVRLDIGQSAPSVLIAFGSRNPETFQPGQGVELVAFLGCVIERLFYSWLTIK
jgi:uncharacterized protein YigA (DUF484 family)